METTAKVRERYWIGDPLNANLNKQVPNREGRKSEHCSNKKKLKNK